MSLSLRLALAAAILAAGAATAEAQTRRPQTRAPHAQAVQPRQNDQSFLYLPPNSAPRTSNYMALSNGPSGTAISPLTYGQGRTDWLQR